ncbi:MarR family winged helix-turn-helix transcriptional regulator [Paraburkholderia caribensis]|uniref:MarR family winged helix-turn-helix transcriptional regulator n=1 Tax=Paraburkholderia caribensis TaxID=75105 RepID=UPI0034D2FC88
MRNESFREQAVEPGSAREIGGNFAQAQRGLKVLLNRLTSALEPIGLTPVQFAILTQIHVPGGTPVATLAKSLSYESSRISIHLGVFERRQLVRVLKLNNGDRRYRNLELTPNGVELTAKAVGLWEETLHTLSREIGADVHSAMNALASIAVATDHVEN